MNYIKKLQANNTGLKDQMSQADEIVVDLYRYLTSEKFHENDMVNVRDVMTRLAPIRSLLIPDEN